MEGETVLGGKRGVGRKVLVEDPDGGGVASGRAGRHVERRLVLAVDQVVGVVHPDAILGGLPCVVEPQLEEALKRGRHVVALARERVDERVAELPFAEDVFPEGAKHLGKRRET